ncbi:MAG TPA: AAA family ATPase [Thermomicrobiales bacterium]|nr:AAA family ATPase [Thermomicrobiales bacterium]
MSTSVLQPVVSPIIVGRDEQLRALDALIERVRGGHGATLLVSGEAGIGKSRLIAELRGRFAGGGPILIGRCFENDRTLPYAPLIDLLRAHLTKQPDGDPADVLGPAGPELVKLLPELAFSVPGLVPSPALEPEQEKRRLFEAIIHVATRLSERMPLLIVIEDLHWCDDVSLEFLTRFVRRIGDQPSLLALTYRGDEAASNLRELLGGVRRERLATELVLQRLDPDDVERMVRAIFQQAQPIRANFLHALVELTDGNPFFIEEVLSALIASGDIYRSGNVWIRKDVPDLRIPHSVQDAVQRRVDQLSVEARAVLRLAAVAGQRFDFAVIAELTGLPERDILNLISELIGASLVTEVSTEQFAFRHALTREAVYGGLLARERRDLHRQIGAAIERLSAGTAAQRLGDLSYHFHAAEEWEKTLDYARRAGERELGRYAPSAAAEHLTRAMEANERLGLAASGDLCRDRARAWATLGEFRLARADYERALECARRDGDRLGEWQSMVDLGEMWAGLDYEQAGVSFQLALDLAREIADQQSIARSLLQLGNWLVNVERLEEAEQSLSSALEMFDSIGDARGAAETVDLLGVVADVGGDIFSMRQRLEQAAALYRDLNDRRGLSSAYASVSATGAYVVVFSTVVPADLPSAEADWYGEEALRIARDIGWRSGEAYAALNLSLRQTFHGDYGRANDFMQLTLAIANDIEHREWLAGGHIAAGVLAVDLLDDRVAEDHFRQAVTLARGVGSMHWTNLAIASLASSLAATGKLDEADAVLEQAAPDLPMLTVSQRQIWYARAELALARGDASATQEIVDGLYATALNVRGEGDIPLLAMLRATCLMSSQRLDEAVAALDAALLTVRARGARPMQARIHRMFATLHQQAGRFEQADAELRQAWELTEEMAVTLSDEKMRDAYLSRVAENSPRPTPAVDDVDSVLKLLTPRERDVVLLLTRGKTNREIAAELFVGPRTVETHVTNILNKLGFTSRTQVAAWAVEQRTPPPGPLPGAERG